MSKHNIKNKILGKAFCGNGGCLRQSRIRCSLGLDEQKLKVVLNRTSLFIMICVESGVWMICFFGCSFTSKRKCRSEGHYPPKLWLTFAREACIVESNALICVIGGMLVLVSFSVVQFILDINLEMYFDVLVLLGLNISFIFVCVSVQKEKY